MNKQRKPLYWTRLDNAAKIYPAARRKNWSSVYRLSATLLEKVDVEVLQSALNVTVKRFPTICARLRKGLFWYYLQELRKAPDLREEYSYPLTFMNKAEMNRCAFRVIAYEERIAVEFFHSLTDGNGAMVFIKSLVAEYLEQKHHIQIPCEYGILDRREPPRPEEMEDCFPKNAGAVPASRKDTVAWRMTGEPAGGGFLTVTGFQIPLREALDLAHKYGVSLTVFFSSVLMMALMNWQNQVVTNKRKLKPIKLMIPINLRRLFPSQTLRNFSMYVTPEIDPRLGEYTLEEICKIVCYKMGMENTAKHMSRVIATNVNDEKNPLVRLIPLPIKNMVMKAVFNRVGEKLSCLSLSNLGAVELPAVMKSYVKRFDFILDVQATAPYNCSMLSYGDTLYFNFIRNTGDAVLERHFYAILQALGLPTTVESNQKRGEESCTV